MDVAEGQGLPVRRRTAFRHQQGVQVGVRKLRDDRPGEIGRVGMDDQQIMPRRGRDPVGERQMREIGRALRPQPVGHPAELGGKTLIVLAGRRLAGLPQEKRISVTLDRGRRHLAHAIHHFRRPRPRPNQVSGHDHLIERPALRHVVQHGVQRNQVAMNIGKEGDPH